MMEILLMILSIFILINLIDKKIFQFIYQNILFIMFFMILVKFPLNNLSIYLHIYMSFGMDYYSFGLILLTFWIISLMMLASNSIYMFINYNIFSLLMNFMLISLMICFLSINLMVFYMSFESSLIPIFLMILGWGKQLERMEASYYLMIYTLFGSMPLFFMLLYLYNLENCLMMSMLKIKFVTIYIYISLMLAFLIKMPMYIVHSWLPKAHVEAPIMGSMILAGVMLKLGSYGLMRILIMSMVLIDYNKFIIILSLMGSFYSSIICLLQVDLKMLVAYSSVVHMGVLMSGLMTLMSWGFMGGYIMMLSHGLCSSGMFCMVNLNYERVKSRSLIFNKGMINIFPSMSLLWFLLCSSNMSFPLSMNLFSEIFLLNSLIMWSNYLILLLMMIMFLGACYNLYMYSFSQHGKLNNLNKLFKNFNYMEYMMLMLHWFPLNLMFLMLVIFI